MSDTSQRSLTDDASVEHPATIVRSERDDFNHTLRNIGLIFRREYKNRVTQRSFIITTIILMIFIALGTCVPTLIAFFSARIQSQSTVAIVNNAGNVAGLDGNGLIQYMYTSLNGTATGSQSADQQPAPVHFVVASHPATETTALKKSVQNNQINVLLVIDRSDSQKDTHFTYYTASNSIGDTDLTQIETMASQLNMLDKSSRLGLNSSQTQHLLAAPDFTVVHTQQGQAAPSLISMAMGYFIGAAGTVLIFMAVYLYGMWVALGVAEEKGSRIMEILLNAATPFQLLWGKIIGIGAAGLTQMVCLVAVGIASLFLQTPLNFLLTGHSGASTLNFDFFSVSSTLLLLLLVYFLLGFLLYATLFAALGALVRRQDEVQNTIGPLTSIFMIGYLASFVGGSVSPDATWFKIMSFVPFWTPTIMLMRIATNTVSSWEIEVSILILLIFIVLCAWVSARIYRFGLLMYGQKPGFGQLVKLFH